MRFFLFSNQSESATIQNQNYFNLSSRDEQAGKHVVGHERGRRRERGERRNGRRRRSELSLLTLPSSSFSPSSFRGLLPLLGQGLSDLGRDQVLAGRFLAPPDDVEEERLAGAEVRREGRVPVVVGSAYSSGAPPSSAAADESGAAAAGLSFEERDCLALEKEQGLAEVAAVEGGEGDEGFGGGSGCGKSFVFF